MPKLYPEIYIPNLNNTDIAIAARMGILHTHQTNIVDQLKDLVRLWIQAKFFHNLPPNTGNTPILSQIWWIDGITPIRISDHDNFYQASIEQHTSLEPEKNKLIFLEKNYIEYPEGWRLNIIAAGEWNILSRYTIEQLIKNVWFRVSVAMMQDAVKNGQISRIHILRAGEKNAIKNELLSLDGSGTLIENNFRPEIHTANEWDIETIYHLFQSLKKSWQLKSRSRWYITRHIQRFIVAEIDTIPLWCVEIIPIDSTTIELGGLAVNAYFMNFKVGKRLIESVEEYAYVQSKNVISITGNQKLATILEARWYTRAEEFFLERANESPGKMLYFRKM